MQLISQETFCVRFYDNISVSVWYIFLNPHLPITLKKKIRSMYQHSLFVFQMRKWLNQQTNNYSSQWEQLPQRRLWDLDVHTELINYLAKDNWVEPDLWLLPFNILLSPFWSLEEYHLHHGHCEHFTVWWHDDGVMTCGTKKALFKCCSHFALCYALKTNAWAK